MKCTQCSAENIGSAAYCTSCGAALSPPPPVQACPACGFAGRPGAKFCAGCGHTFVAALAASPPLSAPPPPRPVPMPPPVPAPAPRIEPVLSRPSPLAHETKSNKTLIVVIACILVVAVLAAVAAYVLNGMRERGDGFWTPATATTTGIGENPPPALPPTEIAPAMAPPELIEAPSDAEAITAEPDVQDELATEAGADPEFVQEAEPALARPAAPRKSAPAPRPVVTETADEPVYEPEEYEDEPVSGPTLDDTYNERRGECAGGFLGSACRKKLRYELCNGLWSSSPPDGQSVCQNKNR